ncbi:MAG TPA: GDSL-type esterase/lipase family protein, partial [Gemmataceae bacterium]|nr:GDSL-type esterase/lipase family protein [Gemmataceae bacterium]
MNPLLSRLAASLFAATALLVSPVAAQEPVKLTFQKGDRVVFVGNTFAERAAEFGYLEAVLQTRLPDLGLTFRNLGYAADEVNLQPRPLNFEYYSAEGPYTLPKAGRAVPRPDPRHKFLAELKADVIFVCYGMNESFRGAAGLADFRKSLSDLLKAYASQKYNGKTAPRIVLISPIAHENLGGELPDPAEHNKHLKLYTDAMREIAAAEKIPFVDLYTPTLALMSEKGGDRLTINGIHLTAYGYWAVAHLTAQQLGLKAPLMRLDAGNVAGAKEVRFPAANYRNWFSCPPPAGARVHPSLEHLQAWQKVANLPPGKYTLQIDGRACAVASADEWGKGVYVRVSPLHDAVERPRQAIIERDRQFFYRWRPTNTEYVYGRRAEPFGVVNFPGEMKQLDDIIRRLDARILELNKAPKITSVKLVPGEGKITELAPVVNRVLSIAELYGQEQGKIGGKIVPTALDPEEARKRFKLAPGYEINLFASEKDFPLHNPLAMQFDAQGRLWVTTLPSYPHLVPGH